jgi:hypothetical protein
MKKHHGAEIGHNIGELEGRLGGEEGDDAKCWERLEVLISLTLDILAAVLV